MIAVMLVFVMVLIGHMWNSKGDSRTRYILVRLFAVFRKDC